MSRNVKLTIAVALLVTACRGVAGPGTDPDDMAADEHRQAANEHQRESDAQQSRYDARSKAGFDESRRQPQGHEGYYRTANYLRLARTHQNLTRGHLAAAALLEEFEEGSCKTFGPTIRSTCPLLGQVDKAEEVPGGARVWVSEGVNVDAAVAHMRCHLAFGRARRPGGMEDCPLYVSQAQVTRVDRSRAVDLTSTDVANVEDLRRRARLHVAPLSIE